MLDRAFPGAAAAAAANGAEAGAAAAAWREAAAAYCGAAPPHVKPSVPARLRLRSLKRSNHRLTPFGLVEKEVNQKCPWIESCRLTGLPNLLGLKDFFPFNFYILEYCAPTPQKEQFFCVHILLILVQNGRKIRLKTFQTKNNDLETIKCLSRLSSIPATAGFSLLSPFEEKVCALLVGSNPSCYWLS